MNFSTLWMAAMAGALSGQAQAEPASDMSASMSFEDASRGSIDAASNAVSIQAVPPLVSVIDPNVIAPAIPEPATVALLVGGLFAVAAVARRRSPR